MAVEIMELKDVILSTLAEMDAASDEQDSEIKSPTPKGHADMAQSRPVDTIETAMASEGDEVRFLENIRERLLVLFEGFQSPNNKQIEAKVDLTLNFLEYLLSSIDSRLDKMKK